jgi:hypothetical protein
MNVRISDEENLFSGTKIIYSPPSVKVLLRHSVFIEGKYLKLTDGMEPLSSYST